MKRIATLMMAFVMIGLVATSCGSSNMAGNTVAYASGSTCAKALTALHSSKTANGSISISNANDVSNMLAVITCYTQLRNNKDNAEYKKSFTNGLIAGSNLINASNAGTIVNGLLGATGLDGVNASNIGQKVQTVSTIITLLNALKG
ncbi:MAG: hypothetical protein MJZ51_01675 [Bacteroidales bacterium]|nr:hypothetical protein [Bacteroidales bacterium]